MEPDALSEQRVRLVQRALGLEWLTVGWNVLEGIVAMLAALGAGSVALLGFGIDSFVESASGAVLIWRLRAEQQAEPGVSNASSGARSGSSPCLCSASPLSSLRRQPGTSSLANGPR
jgi:hypothetical protein